MVSLPDLILPKIRHFGLSIERTGLHVVELIASSKPFKVAASSLPPDLFIEGGLTKPDLLTDSLKEIVKKADIRTPYVAVTFPEVFAYTRAVTLPNLDSGEMHEAINWRIKDLFPLPEEEIYFDWKVLNRNTTDTTVSVVAVQRKVMDPLVGAIVKAGLKPLRFEPDASALSRLLGIPKDRYALLLEINTNGTYMTLVDGDKAVFTSNIAHSNQDSPESYLANIDQGIREIVRYYQDKGLLTENKFNVVITGQMGNSEWAGHVTKLIGCPTNIMSSKIQNPAYYKAYAAAIYGVKPPDDIDSINVLSKTLQATYDRERSEKLQKILLDRTLLMAGLTFFVSGVVSGMLFLEKYNIEGQIKLEKQVGIGTGVTAKKITDLNTLAKLVVSLEPLRKAPVEPLLMLQSTLTDAISITQWEYNDSKLTFQVTGTAATREDLLTFKNRLEEGKMFSKVTLPLGSLETPVSAPFTLSFIVAK